MNIEKKIEIKEKVKKNTHIRTLLSPIMRIMFIKEYQKYLESEDAKYLKRLQNSQKGKRCFIVCNGPSLCTEDLDLIKNEFSFGFNRIYYIFDKTLWRPSIYMSVDKDVISMNKKEIEEINVPSKLLDKYAKKLIKNDDETHFLCSKDGFVIKPYSDKNIGFSSDLSVGYCDGGTVTYVAIQLAIYMGFKEIYLLGTDHNYSVYRKSDGKIYTDTNIENYFQGLNSTGITSMDIDRATCAYMIAKEKAEALGIKIYNATRGGKLEVFDRVTLEHVI